MSHHSQQHNGASPDTSAQSGSATRPKRVLVFGLDGMTYDVIKPLVDAGYMPTFKELMQGGAWGELTSVIPPVTGPAWVSFATGKQPGNHGVFDFFKPTKSSNAVGMTRRIINSFEADGKTLWSILTEHGRTSIVMNVPVTYPAMPIQGVILADMLAPSIDKPEFSKPEGIVRRFEKDLGEYVITVNWQTYSDSTSAQFVRDTIACEEMRTRYCLRLMDEYPDWQLCFPCFTEPDRIQHALWKYIDPKDREELKRQGKYDQNVMDLVIEFYRQVDNDVRRIWEKAGKDTPVFFVSDHGFGPLYGKFYVNTYLERKGLLKYDKAKIRKAYAVLLMKKVQGKFLKTIGLQKAYRDMQARKLEDRQNAAIKSFYDVFYESIDWEHTKAYMASNTEGGLYINVKGRRLYGNQVDRGAVDPADYLKVRQEVIDALKQIRHPHTGKPMLSHVEVREDVYTGKYVDRAPDIVFFLDSGEWLADFGLAKGIFKDADWRTGSGTHRMEGIFLAHAPGVKANQGGIKTNIYNVAPTILGYMGLPIPPDMDGKFIQDAFTDEWKASHPIEYAGSSTAEGKGWGAGASVYNQQDEEALIDRLRGLGYID